MQLLRTQEMYWNARCLCDRNQIGAVGRKVQLQRLITLLGQDRFQVALLPQESDLIRRRRFNAKLLCEAVGIGCGFIDAPDRHALLFDLFRKFHSFVDCGNILGEPHVSMREIRFCCRHRLFSTAIGRVPALTSGVVVP